MKILALDVGGNNVKLLASGQRLSRRFPSGQGLTPQKLVAGVQENSAGWKFDVISMGFPSVVHGGKIVKEPVNLAPGWVGFDFEKAFGCPVRIINDAAMQALGSYGKGLMLFLGLGTGLGSALVADGRVIPLELGHLPYRKSTFEGYVGSSGLSRLGKRKWRRHVDVVVKKLSDALLPDEIVLGGGNVKDLKEFPENCRRGKNSNAFLGAFRLWQHDSLDGVDGRAHRHRMAGSKRR